SPAPDRGGLRRTGGVERPGAQSGLTPPEGSAQAWPPGSAGLTPGGPWPRFSPATGATYPVGHGEERGRQGGQEGGTGRQAAGGQGAARPDVAGAQDPDQAGQAPVAADDRCR